MRGVVLLLAAGEGLRIGGPKALLELDGAPLVRLAADAASAADLVDEIVVASPADLCAQVSVALDGLSVPFVVVAGGDTRQASAHAALDARSDAQAYAVHDAARALCPTELFDACLRALDDVEAVCPALAVTDTIKEISGDVITATLDRAKLVAVQTPQTFRGDLYRRAHAAALADGVDATDDCAIVERLGVQVHTVPGDVRNLKITTHADMQIARTLR